ncbi:MAG TPA: 16S rRNA (adenine(1518)-N(6)/adenine(1519)-N(6))-dimethyltransferase RsmA [Acidimicrobiales bacterium]|nr:16S rRNA (adenine(1518)-N(6)/adenine(1519)-N(6))-dimethyltransferase RsmA [Acidimicrobiales bacterium]
MTLTRTQVTALLASHGLTPSKALGQHFLIDPNTARRIARLAGVGPSDRVLEVGPGLGSLTLALLETGAEVTAVEVDPRLAAVVAEVTGGRCEVVVGDARDVDLSVLGEGPVQVVANLPYNVAVPIVVRLLEAAPAVRALLVMVQTEVAERLAAPPGSRTYGAVTVKVDYFASARVVGRVPRSVFLPEPNVDSSLVALTRRDAVAVDPNAVSEERLFEVVRAAFAHRRKMLRRSLDGVVAPAAFARAGVDPTQRPEELDVLAFGRLAATP